MPKSAKKNKKTKPRSVEIVNNFVSPYGISKKNQINFIIRIIRIILSSFLLFSFDAFLGTRSVTRQWNRFGLTSECFVPIERHLPTIALAWLQQAAPPAPPPAPERPVPAIPAVPAIAVAGAAGVSTVSTNHRARRASIASCRNVFSVDGTIEEVGFDHLGRLTSSLGNFENASSAVNTQPIGPSRRSPSIPIVLMACDASSICENGENDTNVIAVVDAVNTEGRKAYELFQLFVLETGKWN